MNFTAGDQILFEDKFFSPSVFLLSKSTEKYRSIILPVVVYGCETCSITLREKRRLRMFENRVLRRIFGPKRDDVKSEWRKLNIEELNSLYSSPNIFRVIKSRKMSWVSHVARMGKSRGVYRVLVRERDHLEDPGVDGRIILRWIFRKLDVGGWTGLIWLRTVTGGGHL